MDRKIVWTKRTFEFFVEHGKLNQFQREVLETRIAGMTITQQAFYHQCSTATISRCLKDIRAIYVVVQREYPEVLSPMRTCAQEEWQDTH